MLQCYVGYSCRLRTQTVSLLWLGAENILWYPFPCIKWQILVRWTTKYTIYCILKYCAHFLLLFHEKNMVFFLEFKHYSGRWAQRLYNLLVKWSDASCIGKMWRRWLASRERAHPRNLGGTQSWSCVVMRRKLFLSQINLNSLPSLAICCASCP